MAKKIILSVNAGSSSVKVSVFTAELKSDPVQLAEANITGLTAPPPLLSYKRGSTKVVKDANLGDQVHTQDDAFRIILKTFVDDEQLPELSKKEDIGIVAHRIVHGGDFREAKVINAETYHQLEALNDLAPLHNAPSLEIVKSCMGQLPGAINVACFDSQFHASMPEHVRTYPIDQEIAKKNSLRKYGFHGISYAFITRKTAEFLGKPMKDLNIIALHLGSGASACAIKNGQSWDTSMGLTPLAGLPGATRSGSIDPSLVFHYASDVGKLSPASTKELHISMAEQILNSQAGWKALTGTTNFGAIAESTDPKCVLAFDMFVDRVTAYVGSYFVSLKGQVDALVFAGGIGEHADRVRKAVVEQCACLGFEIDPAKNKGKIEGPVCEIGAKSSKARILVCETDEQLEMAHACAAEELLWKDQEATPELTLGKVASRQA